MFRHYVLVFRAPTTDTPNGFLSVPPRSKAEAILPPRLAVEAVLLGRLFASHFGGLRASWPCQNVASPKCCVLQSRDGPSAPAISAAGAA